MATENSEQTELSSEASNTYERMRKLAELPDDTHELVAMSQELRRVLILRCLVELAIREEGSDEIRQTCEEIRQTHNISLDMVDQAKGASLKRSEGSF